jgi:hypothetical protein
MFSSIPFFDKVYIPEALPDDKGLNDEIREVKRGLLCLDKSFILDVIKDNVPLWVTLRTTSNPLIVIPAMVTSFVLSAISTLKISNR